MTPRRRALFDTGTSAINRVQLSRNSAAAMSWCLVHMPTGGPIFPFTPGLCNATQWLGLKSTMSHSDYLSLQVSIICVLLFILGVATIIGRPEWFH